MRKKTFMAAMAISALLISIVGLYSVKLVEANFFPGNALFIESPAFKMVYTSTSVPLSIVAMVANPTPEVASITYCLDENSNVTLTNLTKTLRLPGHIEGSQFSIKLVLENLAEGSHKLEAYSKDAVGKQMNASVEFFVDLSYTMPLSVLSPQNTTYTEPDVLLTFVYRETHRLDGRFTHAAYILDGIGSNYVYENLTLTNLSVGSHKITLSIWTDNYQTFSATIYFTVTNQSTTPSTSPSLTLSPSPTPSPTVSATPTATSTSAPQTSPTKTASPTEPTPTSIPTTENNQTLDLLPVIVISAIVAVGLPLGILAYHKRSRI